MGRIAKPRTRARFLAALGMTGEALRMTQDESFHASHKEEV